MKTKRARACTFPVLFLVMCVVTGGAPLNLCAYAGEPKTRKGDADKDLKKFMQLRTKLQSSAKEREKKELSFAIAEYYFKNNDFFDAQRAFEEYTRENQTGITSFLAQVYLYKLAVKKNDENKIADIKKEIFKDQFVLLFHQYKTQRYVSLFDNRYEVHYFVDRIEIFLNGDIFEQISP